MIVQKERKVEQKIERKTKGNSRLVMTPSHNMNNNTNIQRYEQPENLFLALLCGLVSLALVGLLGLDLHKLPLGVVLDLLVGQDLLHERLLALSVGQAG